MQDVTVSLPDLAIGCFAAGSALPVIAMVYIPRRQLVRPVLFYVMFVALFAMTVGMMMMAIYLFYVRGAK